MTSFATITLDEYKKLVDNERKIFDLTENFTNPEILNKYRQSDKNIKNKNKDEKIKEKYENLDKIINKSIDRLKTKPTNDSTANYNYDDDDKTISVLDKTDYDYGNVFSEIYKQNYKFNTDEDILNSFSKIYKEYDMECNPHSNTRYYRVRFLLNKLKENENIPVDLYNHFHTTLSENNKVYHIIPIDKKEQTGSSVNNINKSANEFRSTNSNYSTAYFGEFGYRYGGGSYEAKPMPPVLEKLLELLRPGITNPRAVVNSCLIRRFKDGSQFAPPHRDDDLVFDPESEMVTYFVGATRKIKFLNNAGSEERDLTLKDGSVLVTSRQSQDFWVHEVEASDAMEASYSITFQHVAPYFINSTALIGDSNTRVMNFGEGKGTFGVWMPGKRVEAFHIEDIPDPLKVGPYRNFIIHTGVNNIKRRDRRSNSSLVNEMESKCTNILEVYPRSRIYISMLLPTKLESLNYRVKELNSMLIELAHSYRNISIIGHSWSILCDRSGCLKSELGRHDKSSGLPLDSDSLHLGKNGYRILAINIKEGIFGKRRGNIRYNNNQVEGRRLAAGQVQTNGPPRDRLSLR